MLTTLITLCIYNELTEFQGTLKLLVKWKGYEDVKDRTWEEEGGLMYVESSTTLLHAITYTLREGAPDIVNEYYKRVGGRPERPAEKPKPGRKRKSMGDTKSKTATPVPAAEIKRRRKSVPKETEAKEKPSTPEANGDGWLPKGKNWDKDVHKVETIVRGEGNEGLLAYLEFTNGLKARVNIQACYEKCPQKVCLPRHCKPTQILNFKQDAPILRIASVSQVVPARV
jgi:chromobox protein 1